MSKFLSKDRKRILLSSLLGSILIITGAFLAGSDNELIFIPGALLMAFAYTGFQLLMCWDRKVTLQEKQYVNADNEDITSRMPRDWMIFILVILLVVISWYSISVFHSFIASLRIGKDFDDDALSKIDEAFALITPYVMINIYFFIKNIPVISILAIPSSRGKNWDYINNQHQSSGTEIMSSPKYSYLHSNIHYSRFH